MGLDSAAKLTPQMVKKRTSCGSQISMASFSDPLSSHELIENKNLSEPWSEWWNASSEEQFYVNDVFILKLPAA